MSTPINPSSSTRKSPPRTSTSPNGETGGSTGPVQRPSNSRAVPVSPRTLKIRSPKETPLDTTASQASLPSTALDASQQDDAASSAGRMYRQRATRSSMPQIVPSDMNELRAQIAQEKQREALLTTTMRARGPKKRPPSSTQAMRESTVQLTSSATTSSSPRNGSPNNTAADRESATPNAAQTVSADQADQVEKSEERPARPFGGTKLVVSSVGQSALRKVPTLNLSQRAAPAATLPESVTASETTGVAGIRARFSSLATSGEATSPRVRPNPRKLETSGSGPTSASGQATEVTSPRALPNPTSPPVQQSVQEQAPATAGQGASAQAGTWSQTTVSMQPVASSTSSTVTSPGANAERLQEQVPGAVTNGNATAAQQNKRTKLKDRPDAGREKSVSAQLRKQQQTQISAGGKKTRPHSLLEDCILKCGPLVEKQAIGSRDLLRVLQGVLKNVSPAVKAKDLDGEIAQSARTIPGPEAIDLINFALTLVRTEENPLGASAAAETVKYLIIDVARVAATQLANEMSRAAKDLSF